MIASSTTAAPPDRSMRRIVLIVIALLMLEVPLASCGPIHVVGYGTAYDQGGGGA